MTKKIFKYFELTFWIVALLLLAIMDPGTNAHFSICIFKLMGIEFCPGCGLGHSISYLFRAKLQASFSAHPMGMFALIVILFRIYKLILLHFFPPKESFGLKKIHYAIR